MKDYRSQLREAFENPAAGGNGRSGVTIPSPMVAPLPVDKNAAVCTFDMFKRQEGGQSLRDREVARQMANIPDPYSPTAPPMTSEQRAEAWKEYDNARVAVERNLGVPVSGLEATPLQALYAGEESARRNQQTAAGGVPDMRNHSRLDPDVSGYTPPSGPRGANERSQMLEGDGKVFPGEVGDRGPGTKIVPTQAPPVADVRGDGRLVGKRLP